MDILVKNPMPVQDAKERNKNFKEVALGYSEETALNEAARCLNCKNMPCVSGCPVKINIPAFIQKVKEGQFEEAYNIISQSSSLPAVCGRSDPGILYPAEKAPWAGAALRQPGVLRAV